MAAPVFVINSTITFYGVKADWQRVPKRQNSDGTIDWQNYAMHTWDIPQMEVATFLSLQALSGQRLTSLATTSLNDRNNGASYAAAEIVEVVNTAQIGRRATSCRVVMRVDVS